MPRRSITHVKAIDHPCAACPAYQYAFLMRGRLRRSYDSIQFLAHSDCEFKACNKNKGTSVMNFEIVSTKLKGMYSCTSSDGQSPLLRTGWQGANPCNCDNSQNNLNCKGLPIEPVKPPLGTC
jgi:hypothetical protein